MRIKQDIILIVVFSLLTCGLYLIPNRYENKEEGIRCTGTVLSVDNTGVQQFGIIRQGNQRLSLRIDSGKYAGRELKASNPLQGQLSLDTVFLPGDIAYVILTENKSGELVYVNPQSEYRLGDELLLFGLFAALLIIFGGFIGVKALLSFVFAGMMVWKVFIPQLLAGSDPIWMALLVVAALSVVIIFLVAGINRTGVTAFLGAFLGVLTACLLSIYFTSKLQVNGAVMPFAVTLLYSGYNHLDLSRIFIAGVFISSSGAMMDLGMDVAASMREIVANNPEIGRRELMWSGIRVGRAVAGTMTTTLLLAYSGGYLTLLMSFLAQGIPLGGSFNFVYVASEVLKTLVGSFGMVAVAPFTAILGGFILCRKKAN